MKSEGRPRIVDWTVPESIIDEYGDMAGSRWNTQDVCREFENG